MFYEDVKIKPGDTIARLTVNYGHPVSKWQSIWQDAKNTALLNQRGKPEAIRAGDILNIPIPWKMIGKSVSKLPGVTKVKCVVNRDGGKGTQIRWVQTVDQSNQPIGATSQQCVDACPPDDADPFYWTSAELAADPALRNQFSDVPSRPAPTVLQGTTKWRAVLSLVVVTDKRVTLLESIFWGFDLTPANVILAIGPRNATPAEVTAHLNLLATGVGTGGQFSTAGWTFRKAAP